MSPGSFEEFCTRTLAGPRYIPEATFVAARDGEVVGYGQLAWMNRAAGLGGHAMLGVSPCVAWTKESRGRSRRAQIGWALDNGLSELRTGNDEHNASARAVNANFLYTSLPDGIAYRGPLVAEP